ncbi:hypothetical protein C7964_11622 [Loktanella sp. PT4BL]|jgi:hypothetical protein|nr:hypothetical protein C7964_11622 [Loktanella sp. PT4BL]
MSSRAAFTTDLQALAFFHVVWRLSIGTEPTGKVFRPLPVIDIKQDLQKSGY